VRGLSDRYAAAAAAIDAANAADPTPVAVRGATEPLALVHGRLAAEWVARLIDAPSEALLLAARAHHLRRWEVPRSSYPEGRSGYQRWRRDQKARHAADVAVVLHGCGYSAAEIDEVQRLVRRDPVEGAQTVEDAACLVFIETQLAEVAARLEHDHLIDVIRKTTAKMSAQALAQVGSVPVTSAAAALLAEAFGIPDNP
jgi:hypothetical protein